MAVLRTGSLDFTMLVSVETQMRDAWKVKPKGQGAAATEPGSFKIKAQTQIAGRTRGGEEP